MLSIQLSQHRTCQRQFVSDEYNMNVQFQTSHHIYSFQYVFQLFISETWNNLLTEYRRIQLQCIAFNTNDKKEINKHSFQVG